MVVVMLGFPCFAPVKKLAVKIISDMTYNVLSRPDVKLYSTCSVLWIVVNIFWLL